MRNIERMIGNVVTQEEAEFFMQQCRDRIANNKDELANLLFEHGFFEYIGDHNCKRASRNKVIGLLGLSSHEDKLDFEDFLKARGE